MAARQRASGYGLPSVFDICTPRKDIRDGLVESELAADLTLVAEGEASPEYTDPAKFFAGTYPTKGIRELLYHVLSRLGGGSSSAIFWLNTSFGGGKTHALISLLHAVRTPPTDVISEFVDPALLPSKGSVRIAIFDGQHADISSGHNIGDGVVARTPWGEIAFKLAGKSGYNRVDDRATGSAPGADTLRGLLGDGPVLILLDELAVYLRKAQMHQGAEGQFTAFLTALIRAVEASPNTALVYTLAEGGVDDAYSDENRRMGNELESVSSRKATLLNPTEEGETIQILRRRLFERRDESQVDVVVDAYCRTWKANRDKISDVVDIPKTTDEFRAGYPLHPDVLNTLISKTSTLENFQRVRGMLRILGYVVHDLWKRRDTLKPTAIHLHHLDIGAESIRLEITSKLKQEIFAAAIDTDIACDDENKTSLAQRLDEKHYPNMPPFTTYITRVIFMNTLAYNQQLKGIDVRSLRYSILWPGLEIGYVDEALARFKEESLYLDDNPEKPTQFQAAPNLSQAVQRAGQSLDDQDLKKEIDQRIRNAFQKGEFDLHVFPDGHEDVPDDANKPKLIIPKYDKVSASNPESPPEIIYDIFQHKGIGKGIRIYRNNVVFLIAFDDGVDTIYATARRHLAMSKLATPNSITGFADYQQRMIRERKASSDTELDAAIMACYKYAYYPTKGDVLDYTRMDWEKGGGQQTLLEKLRSIKKVRMAKDSPDLPESIRDRISGLKQNGMMSSLDFRNQFYLDPALPMLIGDRVFKDGIRLGIETAVFVYKRGELVCGEGDPHCEIHTDGDSIIYTTEKARKQGIWPRNNVVAEPLGKTESNDDSKYGNVISTFDLSLVSVTDKPSNAARNVLNELRKHDIDSIVKMQIESKNDVFPLLSMISRIREIDAGLKVVGDYQTSTDDEFRFEFKGTLNGAEPMLEFLRPQLRNANVSNVKVSLDINFKDHTGVDWLETLAGRLKLVENDITISGIAGASK